MELGKTQLQFENIRKNTMKKSINFLFGIKHRGKKGSVRYVKTRFNMEIEGK